MNSLDIDIDSLLTLCAAIKSEHIDYFSRIKTIRLENLFCGNEIAFGYGWDILLRASQTLTTLDIPIGEVECRSPYIAAWCIHDINTDPEDADPGNTDSEMLDTFPFDLGRLPALRHFKIQMRSSCDDNQDLLCFLTRSFSISSSSSGIETLEIGITWYNVRNGHGKDLFSFDAGWSALDELFTSKMYGSLSKVILRLRLQMGVDWIWLGTQFGGWDQQIWEPERNLTLPYVNNLLPLFRALTDAQRTLETHFEAVKMAEKSN